MPSNALNPDRKEYALLIVGSGPAGLSTALHLAQIAPDLIPDLLVLEKAHHPRHKLCGGGLLPDAEVILEQLGLDVSEVPQVQVDWARFDFEGQGFRMRPDPRRGFAFRVVRRHEFDAWLARKASQRGIRLLEGVTVRAVQTGPAGVSLETDSGTFRARALVGADGSASVVRRAVMPREATHTARLLEIVTEPSPDRSFHEQADSYFDFAYVPGGILGYSWDFPALEDGRPVRVRGIYDSNVYPRRTRISLREALADEFRLHGYELGAYRLEGHPLRWFEAGSLFSMPRILLVGDAAGADALFGEGISLALGYGSLAAQAIQAAFTSGDFSFHGYRAAVLGSEMGKSLRRRTAWAKFFYRLRWSWIQRLVWRHLGGVIVFIMERRLIGWARRQAARGG